MEETQTTQNPEQAKVNAVRFDAFLKCVKETGAHICMMDGDKKVYYFIKKGSPPSDFEPVTLENLVDFKPMKASKHRKVFGSFSSKLKAASAERNKAQIQNREDGKNTD
jgi:hypothetical protein